MAAQQKIHQKNFTGQRIELDGKHFTHCQFLKCTLIYSASGPVGVEHCTFDTCRWDFQGAAASTITFLHFLYHSGRGGMEVIEATFNNIRAKPEP